MNKFCVVIPVYRHLKPLVKVIDGLEEYGLPCLLVDDGNEPPLKSILAAELDQRPWVEVVRVPLNGGKGVASVAGFHRALERGFTHAVFLDADGQHNDRDLPRALDMSRQHPEALILGRPRFDETAPLSRRLGRLASRWWVWIETLSFTIGDPLCGFRCYPLRSVAEVVSRTKNLGRRMNFDPEIIVRLFWHGVPVINFDTPVCYPLDGISNFRMWSDNVALFKLHSKLFFEMLFHCPALLRQRMKRAS